LIYLPLGSVLKLPRSQDISLPKFARPLFAGYSTNRTLVLHRLERNSGQKMQAY
jgi:hypothetical protein